MLIPKFVIFHGKSDVLWISHHLQMFGGFLKWGGTLRINLNRCFYSKTIQLLGYHGVPLWKATFLDVFQLVTMVFSQVLLAAKAASSASSSCSSNWDATELLQSQISKASTWLEVWVENP